METYTGMHAAEISFTQFWRFTWSERRELWRYLRWADGMRIRAEEQRSPARTREEG